MQALAWRRVVIPHLTSPSPAVRSLDKLGKENQSRSEQVQIVQTGCRCGLEQSCRVKREDGAFWLLRQGVPCAA